MLVHEILYFANRLHHFAFAGTALTLYKIGRIGSAVGKAGAVDYQYRINGVDAALNTMIFKNNKTSLSKKEDVEKFVALHINLEGCGKSVEQLEKLTGRRRNSANLIFEIYKDNKMGNKSEILARCINNTYEKMVNEIYKNLDKYCKQDLLVLQTLKELFVYSSFFEDRQRHYYPSEVDILELAVCDVDSLQIETKIQVPPKGPSKIELATSDQGDKNKFKDHKKYEQVVFNNNLITELVAVEGLIKYAKSNGWEKEGLVMEIAIKTFETFIKATENESSSSEKGKAFEILCFASLNAKYKGKGKSFYDIEFVGKDDRQEWMKKVVFAVKAYGSTEDLFKGMKFDEYLEQVATFSKSNDKELDKYLNYIVMPPNEVHPDGIWITKSEGKLYFVLFSCKCYTTALDARYSHCSTMIDRLYLDNYTKDDPFNPSYYGNNKTNRGKKRWSNFIEQFGLKDGDQSIIGGVLRVHIHVAPNYKKYTKSIDLLKGVKLPPTASVEISLNDLKGILDMNSYDLLATVLARSEKQTPKGSDDDQIN